MSETQEPGSKFVVLNDVTGQVEETDQDPSFGDPNSSLQAQVTSAYGGSAGSSMGAASTTAETPTPSMMGDPAAQALAAAEASANVSPEQVAQLRAALGGMAALGQVPSMVGQMAANAQTVLNNTTKVFAGINNIFQPEEVGTPGRCASLGDFIGSLQGKFNSALEGITSGLGQLTNSLISVPMTILNGFAASATALVSAITSGVSSAINAALSGVTSAATAVLNGIGAAGQAVLKTVAGAVTAVTSALMAEAANLTSALNSLLNNPFKIVVPTVNACMKSIFENNPATQSQNTGVAALASAA